jgi:hypothetical protein
MAKLPSAKVYTPPADLVGAQSFSFVCCVVGVGLATHSIAWAFVIAGSLFLLCSEIGQHGKRIESAIRDQGSVAEAEE